MTCGKKRLVNTILHRELILTPIEIQISPMNSPRQDNLGEPRELQKIQLAGGGAIEN